MLTSKYFIREPVSILTHKECDKITVNYLKKQDGLIYCTVLPNQKLFYPVLPYRCNKKLLFPSCRTCAETLSIEQCSHSKDERSITGVWSLCEAKAAFDRGYELIKVHELWIYESENGKDSKQIKKEKYTYDDLIDMQNQGILTQNDKGFFNGYQNAFIQLKGEASGFPNTCCTDDEKKQHIADFYNENNVLLRLNEIEYNSTKRELAKLMLNSLYGKLIQQGQYNSTAILKDPTDLSFYLNSDIFDVLDFYCINDNYAVVCWSYKTNEKNKMDGLNPRLQKCQNKNICLTTGIQTTTGARLRLYGELEKLKDRCLYMDTDSILFVQHNDEEYCPTLSSAIGGFKNELEEYRKYSDFEPYINEFVCIGPKTYAYSIINEPETSPTFKPIIVVKCKGLTLQGLTAKKITMELLKSFVLGQNFTEDSNLSGDFYFDSVETKRLCIRPVLGFKVVSREEKKKFRFTFDKRIVRNNLITYPFGYKE